MIYFQVEAAVDGLAEAVVVAGKSVKHFNYNFLV